MRYLFGTAPWDFLKIFEFLTFYVKIRENQSWLRYGIISKSRIREFGIGIFYFWARSENSENPGDRVRDMKTSEPRWDFLRFLNFDFFTWKNDEWKDRSIPEIFFKTKCGRFLIFGLDRKIPEILKSRKIPKIPNFRKKTRLINPENPGNRDLDLKIPKKFRVENLRGIKF